MKQLKKLAETEKEVQEGEGTKKVPTPLYKLTHEKIVRMEKRLNDNGFTSFAEA